MIRLRFSFVLGWCLASALTLFWSPSSTASQSKNDTLPTLRVAAHGGYLLGGQVFSESFSYNPAFSVGVTLYKPLNETVNLGIGVSGNFTLLGERLIPIYASFLGFSKPGAAGTYFLVNAGYAPAWRVANAGLDHYEIQGGAMFKTGIGRRFLVGSHSIMVGVALQHQWANAEFDSGFGLAYKEKINFDWLALELRFFY